MTKKLRLDLDQLTVESFDTDRAPLEHGTIHAHAGASGQSCTYNCTIGEPTCRGLTCGCSVPVVTCLC